MKAGKPLALATKPKRRVVLIGERHTPLFRNRIVPEFIVWHMRKSGIKKALLLLEGIPLDYFYGESGRKPLLRLIKEETKILRRRLKSENLSLGIAGFDLPNELHLTKYIYYQEKSVEAALRELLPIMENLYESITHAQDYIPPILRFVVRKAVETNIGLIHRFLEDPDALAVVESAKTFSVPSYFQGYLYLSFGSELEAYRKLNSEYRSLLFYNVIVATLLYYEDRVYAWMGANHLPLVAKLLRDRGIDIEEFDLTNRLPEAIWNSLSEEERRAWASEADVYA